MVIPRLAFRSLLRRKGRGMLIGSLVAVGTLLLVFGGTFASSAKSASRDAIIDYFTGDFILYAGKSKDIPSPFSFNTPLPVLENLPEIQSWLAAQEEVESFVSYSQNYGLIQVKKGDKTYDLPFIFYAVDPVPYRETFNNVPVKQGKFFQEDGGEVQPGIVISVAQNQRYQDRYGLSLSPGDEVTLLSLTSGGSVNAVPSKVQGIFEPAYYKNVFDYINYMDMDTYAQLYNFTGVTADSIPDAFNQAMSATSEEDIFGLADAGALVLDTETLKSQELTGYTMVAVKLKDHNLSASLVSKIQEQGWSVKVASWDQASTFFADIADILQTVILVITVLIFLVTAFILMNTQIINVLERTGEIGTLRAIGAEKNFVTALFLWESFLLTGAAALVGMILSVGLMVTIGGSMPLPEVMSQYLIGGGPLKLEFTPWPFLLGFVLVLGVSFLSTLYPTRVAAGVSPLSAMSGR